ncbi:hypothetical protein [Paraburkholderia caffeinilytica]|uniref:hypothetical protein n=1 Tax=Paraburkholderia caffeinilytica TaxID=1761016 RepID=UPI0038BD7B75
MAKRSDPKTSADGEIISDIEQRAGQLRALLALMEGDGSEDHGINAWSGEIRAGALSLAHDLARSVSEMAGEASRRIAGSEEEHCHA